VHVSSVNERFSEALKARLNGRYASLFYGPAAELSPARARQAEVPEPAIAAAAAEALGVEFADDLQGRPISHDFLSNVPISFARRHAVVGLSKGNGELVVAAASLAQWPRFETLSKLLGRPVRPIFAPRDEILRTINAAYQEQTGGAQQVIEEIDRDEVLREIDRAGGNEDLLDVSDRAPVVRLVNLTLFEAVKRRASDVHVQPYDDRLVVRLRVDGVLHDVFHPPRALHEEIVSRIKVMGGMDIAERRLAQDGRATVEVGDRLVDLRIATLPTCYGERAVIRLLDKSARLYELEELGMRPRDLEAFRRLIHMDHGIILVTGPTGSGKTTTLYAALREINAQEQNIITLEDPIEYRLDGISQTQVSGKKGMTFAGGLRHVLRQDPDIIMVGEIRDADTARMAIQSALTGHLVFSTLHTNDAAGAVSRMLNLGVESYLLASSLVGVLAQRLVRRICEHCRTTREVEPADRLRWGLSEEDVPSGPVHSGAGCAECLHTGYRERIGLFELLTVAEPVREQILKQAKASTIKSLAVSAGMETLRADGLAKAREGITTMDEAVRVTGRDEF
jgi:general secretion pathway protein E